MSNLRPVIEKRYERLKWIGDDPARQATEMELCRRDPLRWFDNWVWTYDPRQAGKKNPDGSRMFTHMPMDLYPRQRQMVQFLDGRLLGQEDGLIEKSRDIGFTWIAGGWALHKWLYVPGFKTAFGSRKEEYVDKKGEPDCIFEKIRMVLQELPPWMQPIGFNGTHDNYMRLVNPQNGNTIRGEAGEQMGRGGRASVYFIDEAAFLSNGDSVDAATSGNSDVRIWGSSVQGMGNLFARKRHGGQLAPHQIFRFHYTDDPRKTPEWAEKKKRTLEKHVWASEYEIDYSASVEGICIPAVWVAASQELRQYIDVEPAVEGIAGLDVGAGKAKSVFTARFGPVVCAPVAWGDPDTTETANRALDQATATKLQRKDKWECTVKTLHYDSVGVGAGVLSALENHEKKTLSTYAINMGVSPSDTTWPDGETSDQKFANLKAECWWLMRERFKCSHELLLFLKKEKGGIKHKTSDCIVLPPSEESPEVLILVGQLSLPKYTRNEKGKTGIEKKESLTKRSIPSPDHAESLSLTFARNGGTSIWGSA